MNQEGMANTIQKLLAKAERAGTEEEAIAFFAKAQELMTKHGIDEAMLDAAQPERKSLPGQQSIVLGRQGAGIKARRNLLANIGALNGCKVWMSGDRATLTVAGFNADVENTMMMFSSVDAQMASSMRAAARLSPQGSSATWKTNFMYGYGSRIAHRLVLAKIAAREAAEAEAPGTSLVLVSRQAEVEDYVANRVGRMRKGPPAKHQHHAGATAAGREAANRADLGGPRPVAGTPRGTLGA